jgi:hypothetical protein
VEERDGGWRELFCGSWIEGCFSVFFFLTAVGFDAAYSAMSDMMAH